MSKNGLFRALHMKPVPEEVCTFFAELLAIRIHAEWLAEVERQGLTEEQLAERLGWTVTRVRRHLREPTGKINEIAALLAVVGCELRVAMRKLVWSRP